MRYLANEIENGAGDRDADKRSADDVGRIVDAGDHAARGHKYRRDKEADAPLLVIEIDGGREREKESRVAGRERPLITDEKLLHIIKRRERPRTVIEKAHELGNAEIRDAA